jgi:hypothetical protein
MKVVEHLHQLSAHISLHEPFEKSLDSLSSCFISAVDEHRAVDEWGACRPCRRMFDKIVDAAVASISNVDGMVVDTKSFAFEICITGCFGGWPRYLNDVKTRLQR